MPATRTGVSSLRHMLRALCKLGIRFPGLLTDPSVPAEIGLAVAAVIAACIASDFDNPGEGEISGMGTTP